MKRLKNILIGLDQFLWVLLTLGGGSPDETISAAMWRLELSGSRLAKIARKFIDFIALKVFDEKDHCQLSYTAEKLNTQLPKEYR